MEVEQRWNVDERIWREKVRRFEHENRALKEDLARHLGHSADHEQVNVLTVNVADLKAAVSELSKQADTLMGERNELASENKELKDKIKGLNMQLGRYKNKG